MDITGFLTDEDAASSVIGVVLMVAVAVILAAVIGQFVLGLGDKVNNSAPQADFEFSKTTVGGSDPNNPLVNLTAVRITHAEGDAVDMKELDIRVNGNPAFGINTTETQSDTDQVKRPLNDGERLQAGDDVLVHAYYTGDKDFDNETATINEQQCVLYFNNGTIVNVDEPSPLQPCADIQNNFMGVTFDSPDSVADNSVLIQPGDEVAIYWTDPESDDSAKLADYEVP